MHDVVIQSMLTANSIRKSFLKYACETANCSFIEFAVSLASLEFQKRFSDAVRSLGR